MGSSGTARGTCAAVASPVLKISIVGHNDMLLVDMIDTALTTVCIGHVAMGRPQPSGKERRQKTAWSFRAAPAPLLIDDCSPS